MFKPVLESDGSDFNSTTLESLGYHLIFGEINESSMKEAIAFILKANLLCNHGELTLYINSSGGNCSDGFALIDLMSISRLPITTIASGNISSMGLLIACAGTKGKRIITRNTEVMAHQYSDGLGGKFHELLAQHAAQLQLAHQFIEHFKRHSTMTEEKIYEIVFSPTDRWLTPSECKTFGLVDIILDELPPFRPPQSGDTRLSHQQSGRNSRIGKRKKR